MAIASSARSARGPLDLRSPVRVARRGAQRAPATALQAAPELVAYRKALGKLQAVVAADKLRHTVPDAQGLLLRPGMSSFVLAHKAPTGKGTVVLFHGYTAGPWQYPEMAKRFYQAGYDVYVPRLPGHGMTTKDGTPSGAEVPSLAHEAEYHAFVDQVYSDVSGLNGPVYAAGLSGGADLAMDMAVRHPQIARVALMSPFLGPDGKAGTFFQTLLKLGQQHPWIAKILDHIPTELNVKYQPWMGSPDAPFAKWPLGKFINGWIANVAKPGDPMPHTETSLGAVLGMMGVGRGVAKLPVPAQFLNTAGDFLSGTGQVGPLYERSGGASRDGWFVFPESLGVPHAMTSPKEDKVPGAAHKVQDIVFKFLDQGRPTN